METRQILDEIEAEIARLTQVRNLLAGREGGTSFRYGTNRAANGISRKKRVLSAEARARIAAAQKKRWAAQKKAAK